MDSVACGRAAGATGRYRTKVTEVTKGEGAAWPEMIHPDWGDPPYSSSGRQAGRSLSPQRLLRQRGHRPRFADLDLPKGPELVPAMQSRNAGWNDNGSERSSHPGSSPTGWSRSESGSSFTSIATKARIFRRKSPRNSEIIASSCSMPLDFQFDRSGQKQGNIFTRLPRSAFEHEPALPLGQQVAKDRRRATKRSRESSALSRIKVRLSSRPGSATPERR